MNILKSVLACVAVATFSLTAMATTPKGDAIATPNGLATNNASAVKSESKSKLMTFYVVGADANNYTLQAESENNPSCDGSESPCEITSSDDLGTSQPRSVIDAQGGTHNITIVTKQDQL